MGQAWQQVVASWHAGQIVAHIHQLGIVAGAGAESLPTVGCSASSSWIAMASGRLRLRADSGQAGAGASARADL